MKTNLISILGGGLLCLILLSGCERNGDDDNGNDNGYSQIRMITNNYHRESFRMRGAGIVTIDWGDGTIQTDTLVLDNYEFYFHEYSTLGTYTTTITGGHIIRLTCGSNQLTSLDVSGCAALTDLDCSWNQLTSLNVSGCKALTWLGCGNNQLTSLDVSNNTALIWLYCEDNQLTSLDVSSCATLRRLYCEDNQLMFLNVSGCTAIEELSCYYNKLTSLDVSGYAALAYLNCEDNKLTYLDVSGCIALTYLDCSDNQLTSLDVSGCTALTDLYCRDNQLTNNALDSLFSTLHNNTYTYKKSIFIYRNPGASACDRSIAEKKGWKVYLY